VENYNFNQNSNNSGFGKPKSGLPPRLKKKSSSKSDIAASSGMDGRWWLWYLKNQMQGDGSKEKASS